MNICPVCKMPYTNAASKFCSHCGTARPKMISCPNCGTLLEPDARYCDSCGERTALGQQVDKALGKE